MITRLKTVVLWIMSACVSGWLAGCLLLSPPDVEVEAKNRSSVACEKSLVYFGEYACQWGFVGRNLLAVYHFFPHPITPEAEFHCDQDGKYRVE